MCKRQRTFHNYWLYWLEHWCYYTKPIKSLHSKKKQTTTFIEFTSYMVIRLRFFFFASKFDTYDVRIRSNKTPIGFAYHCTEFSRKPTVFPREKRPNRHLITGVHAEDNAAVATKNFLGLLKLFRGHVVLDTEQVAIRAGHAIYARSPVSGVHKTVARDLPTWSRMVPCLNIYLKLQFLKLFLESASKGGNFIWLNRDYRSLRCCEAKIYVGKFFFSTCT